MISRISLTIHLLTIYRSAEQENTLVKVKQKNTFQTIFQYRTEILNILHVSLDTTKYTYRATLYVGVARAGRAATYITY